MAKYLKKCDPTCAWAAKCPSGRDPNKCAFFQAIRIECPSDCSQLEGHSPCQFGHPSTCAFGNAVRGFFVDARHTPASTR